MYPHFRCWEFLNYRLCEKCSNVYYTLLSVHSVNKRCCLYSRAFAKD